MEMEGINGDAHIFAVNGFYHVIGCAELIDGAFRMTAELQGYTDIVAYFIRQIVKDSSSPLGESFRCGFMNRKDMVERVERTEMDGIYSSLSHVSILRYDSREIGQEKIV